MTYEVGNHEAPRVLEPLWAVLSIGGLAGIHYYLGRREIRARWGDLNSGLAFERARKALLQCNGGMRSNTVLVGWSENPERFEDFGKMLLLIRHMNRSIIALKCDEEKERWATPNGTIDVWWQTRQHGSLMLLLCYLLLQNQDWRNREIRLLLPVTDEAERPEAEKLLTEIQAIARIPVLPEIVVTKNIAETIHQHSASAGLVFIEFDPPIEGREQDFVQGIGKFTQGFSNVIMVSDAGDVSLGA